LETPLGWGESRGNLTWVAWAFRQFHIENSTILKKKHLCQHLLNFLKILSLALTKGCNLKRLQPCSGSSG
jgi:hypothetical protein